MFLNTVRQALIAATLGVLGLLGPVVPAATSLPVTGSGTSLNPVPGTISAVPTFAEFARSVTTGEPGVVTGVYVPETLALRVAQQPANNPAYVSPAPGYATQFGFASRFGTIGLLAHNYLAGALFYNLSIGQEVTVVYGDGTIQRAVISSIRRFQALSPTDPYSDLVDLDSPGARLSSTQVFREVYASGNAVVFQTCIAARGISSWGRLFVIATPAG